MLNKIETVLRKKATEEFHEMANGLRKLLNDEFIKHDIPSHYTSNLVYEFVQKVKKNPHIDQYLGNRACQKFMDKLENLSEELEEIRDIAEEGYCNH